MKSDTEKSKNQLLEELKTLRQQAAEAGDLKNRLAEVEKSNANLKKDFEERTKELKQECSHRDHTEEALRMAEVIVDRSPAILFRHKADDKRTLVYVSNNIQQLGYTAEEFFSGRTHFRDIVHPDDVERVGAEVRGFAEKDLVNTPRSIVSYLKAAMSTGLKIRHPWSGMRKEIKPIIKASWWTSPSASLPKKRYAKAKRNSAGLWRQRVRDLF